MDERDFGGGAAGGMGGGAEGLSAGPANTPSFDPEGAGTTGGGRPPSHRELREGTLGETGGGGAGGSAEGIASEAESRVNETMSRAAGGLETAAHRLDEFGDRYTGESGVRATAGNMAHQVADTFESTARYLRDNDVRTLQQNLERQVRENPLQTLLIGVAAGWIVGKILR